MRLSLRSLLLAGALLALLVAGCGSASGRRSALGAPQAMATAAPAPMEVPAERVMLDHAAAGWSPGPVFAGEEERKIILTANLQLVVKDTENTIAAIKGLVAADEGYVTSANVWRDGNLLQAQLTVRVPAARMDSFLADVKKLAIRVEREESGGQDVTEEYVDLGARLRNLEAAETELRTLLTDVREKTGKAEDVMAVYRELVNVRGEIEQIKGRMQYLDRSAQMATISLQLSERQAEPIGQPGWQPLQTTRRALNALVEALKFGVEAVIWILILAVPLAGLPALVIWAIWRLTRRRRALAAKARAAEEELKRVGG